jgi:hypothetical protein
MCPVTTALGSSLSTSVVDGPAFDCPDSRLLTPGSPPCGCPIQALLSLEWEIGLRMVFNILKTGIPTVILLDGAGYSAAARQWLLEQVHEKGGLSAFGQ